MDPNERALQLGWVTETRVAGKSVPTNQVLKRRDMPDCDLKRPLNTVNHCSV